MVDSAGILRGRCAVIIHGYSDAKVGGIAWAPLLRSLGYSVLAVDLRAHGESEGTYCTAGYWERHDVNQMIDQWKAMHAGETRHMILFGISMGAAVAAAAAALRDDLAAVILESPYRDFSAAASNQATRLGMPGPFFQARAIAVAQWIATCDFSAVRPVDLIPSITSPLMVIQAGNDPFLSGEDSAMIRRAVESRPAASGPSVLWMLEGVHHVVGMCDDPDEYYRAHGRISVAGLANDARGVRQVRVCGVVCVTPLEVLSQDFHSTVRLSGQDYFNRNRVRITDAYDGVIKASVRGTRIYQVSIELTPDLTVYDCSCPYFQANEDPCKHVWATLLTADAQNKIPADVVDLGLDTDPYNEEPERPHAEQSGNGEDDADEDEDDRDEEDSENAGPPRRLVCQLGGAREEKAGDRRAHPPCHLAAPSDGDSLRFHVPPASAAQSVAFQSRNYLCHRCAGVHRKRGAVH